MRARWWLAIVFVVFAGRAWAVYYGQARAEVLVELGKPVSALTRGGREVLLYPNGVRLELEAGKVVFVKGMEVSEGPLHVEAQALEGPKPGEDPMPGEAPADLHEKAPEEPAPTPAELKAMEEAQAQAEKEFAEANAKAREEMEKAITQLEAIHERKAEPPPGPRFELFGFLVEVFVKWLMMLAALKLTCKYWNADVDWSGLMIAAAADTGVRVVVSLIGVFVLDMITLFYADEAIAAIVLLLVLKKVSTNQSTAQAATITLTSKVFSIVVGSLLVTVMLNALH